MSEMWQIILTATLTVAGGIIIYFFSHLFVAFFVEPIHRLRSLIGEIADSLAFYADIYSNPGTIPKKESDEARKVLRRQASQLKARAYSVPWYPLWAFVRFVRSKTVIEKASAELIGLSNAVHGGAGSDGAQNYHRRILIEQLLGIKKEERQRNEHYPLSSYVLSQGILLFFFTLILLGLQVSEVNLFGWVIPAWPIWFYTGLGIISLAISILLLALTFWGRKSVELQRFLEERPGSRWRALIQWLYWVVFWLVYFAGWFKGLSSISPNTLAFQLAFWGGLLWFFTIPIFVGYRLYLHRRQ